jgi:hypothetical protein
MDYFIITLKPHVLLSSLWCMQLTGCKQKAVERKLICAWSLLRKSQTSTAQAVVLSGSLGPCSACAASSWVWSMLFASIYPYSPACRWSVRVSVICTCSCWRRKKWALIRRCLWTSQGLCAEVPSCWNPKLQHGKFIVRLQIRNHGIFFMEIYFMLLGLYYF